MFRHFREVLPHTDLTQVYAQAEATFLTAYCSPQRLLDEHEARQPRPASCGRKTPGIELEMVRDDGTPVEPSGGVGEIVVRHSELLMSGGRVHEAKAEIAQWDRSAGAGPGVGLRSHLISRAPPAPPDVSFGAGARPGWRKAQTC